ncbi:hypothetical protein D3C71_868310 [compost metagenome]
MVTEVGFHQIADFTLLEGKGRVFKRLDHGAPSEEIQIATCGGRSFVVRGLLGHIRKRGWRLAHLGQQFRRTCLGLLTVGRRCVLGGIDQDVAGATLFLASHARNVFLVVGAQVVLIEGDTGTHAVEVQNHILHRSLLHLKELCRICLVVGLQICIRGRNLGREICRLEAHHLDFSLLIERVQRELDLGIGTEGGPHHTTDDLVDRQIAAHIGLEAFRRQTLRTHQGPIGFCVQRTVSALEPCNGGNLLQAACQPRITRHQVHFLGGSCQHAVAHQALQRGVAGLWRVKKLGIDRGRLRTHAVGLHAMGIVPVSLVDLVAIDARHHWALFREVVAVNAYQHKRWNDQQEQ